MSRRSVLRDGETGNPLPNFKIGDRVRVLKTHWAQYKELAGKRGVVVMVIADDYEVDVELDGIYTSRRISVAHLEHEKGTSR